MSKTEWRGGALIAPLPPAMISCGTMEKSNILTVAWTGITNTVPPKTYISVRPRRYSYNIIKESGEFVINLTTEDLIRATDYCGMYTGAKVDKFEKCGLHREEVPGFSCPMIAEAPLSLACRVTDVVPLGSHDMFLADIVSVHVDDALIGTDGKLRLDKAHLAAFAHGEYFALGKKLGNFGFSAVKPKKKKKHPKTPGGTDCKTESGNRRKEPKKREE
ncbi:MAG: flavin reductase family protein [Clostridia bacterium]|nr:flavin reductase family protein [Clostridia bacterium]